MPHKNCLPLEFLQSILLVNHFKNGQIIFSSCSAFHMQGSGGAEWEIGTYGDEDGEMDVWCIAEG